MNKTKLKNKHFSPQKRLEVLSLAAKLGDISGACLLHGIERSTFYSWKKRYEANKLSGLSRKPKSVSNHPFKVTNETAASVISFCLANPSWGCSRIASALKEDGISISSPTVQKILIKEKLGTVSQRLFRLEKKYIKEGWAVSSANLALFEKNDPCFKEFNQIGTYPGEVMVQGTFPVFDLIPNTYIYVVIDTYSSYAFAYPWSEKSAQLAIDLLKVKALRFFANPKFIVKKIITDRGCEFTQFGQTYTNFLHSHGISHEIYSGNKRNWNGFIERYKKSFFERYRRRVLSSPDAVSINETVQSIKNDKMNAERSVDGYPNFGMTPSKLHKSQVP